MEGVFSFVTKKGIREITGIKNTSPSKAAFLPPLFDRLTCEDVDLLDEGGLMASIKKEVSLMMNTRCSAYKLKNGLLEPSHGNLPAPEKPYSFPELLGLADFSCLDGANPTKWYTIELHLEASLAAFEPRLKNPTVKIEKFERMEQKLFLTISGEIVFGQRVEQISFPLAFEIKSEKRG